MRYWWYWWPYPGNLGRSCFEAEWPNENWKQQRLTGCDTCPIAATLQWEFSVVGAVIEEGEGALTRQTIKPSQRVRAWWVGVSIGDKRNPTRLPLVEDKMNESIV